MRLLSLFCRYNILCLKLYFFLGGLEMSIDSWQSSTVKVRDLVDSRDTVPILEQKLPEIQAIADSAIDILADGFQFTDVIAMFEFIGPLFKMASEIESLDKQQKEQFVVDAVWFIYKTVDTYPDGEGNRINVPILIGSMETAFEKKLLDFSTRAAVKAVAKVFEEKGWV
jgi:hypothetical protein